MAGKLACWSLVPLAALVLGVAGAGGRSLATTTVQVQVIGLGTVSQSSINCGAGHKVCYATYPGSGTIELTAAAEPGWTFTGWSGNCSSSPCTLTLGGSAHEYEVIANFTTALSPGTSRLSVSATGDSAGNGGNVSGGDIDCDTGDTSDCTWDVTTGSTATVVETPDPDAGFIFSGWGGGLCSGTARSCTLTMDEAHSVSAAFRKPTLTVRVTGNGTVAGGGIACTSAGGAGCSAGETAGADVTLTATPAAGGSFTDWTGACTGKNTTCTIAMTGDKGVTATFSGGGTTPSTFPLSVSVTGNGTVTGTGINCGGGGSDCAQNETAGSSVTLTATPASGATFTGWGGACSGTAKTCTVSMTSAKSVSAAFSGGGTGEVLLSVSVSGPGAVSGGGITCGSGATSCSAKERLGSAVGLTASPAAGAVFVRWGGACHGTTATCTVVMDAAKSVSATFRTSSPGPPGTSAAVLRSLGRPLVKRMATVFEVTLRFSTTQHGRVHVRALRAGRLETALSFTAAAGPATIGPFPLAKPGFYTFDLTLGARALHWGACLGRCGEAAASSPFTLTRRAPTVVDAGALWSLTLHLHSTEPAGIDLRVYRGRSLARDVRFASGAGAVTAGALLLSPGSYTLRLTATDAYGRVRTLTWFALLP